ERRVRGLTVAGLHAASDERRASENRQPEGPGSTHRVSHAPHPKRASSAALVLGGLLIKCSRSAHAAALAAEISYVSEHHEDGPRNRTLDPPRDDRGRRGASPRNESERERHALPPGGADAHASRGGERGAPHARLPA